MLCERPSELDSAMSLKKVRYLAEYLVFCGLVFVIRALPVERSVQLARFLAWILHRGLPPKLILSLIHI